MPDPDLSTSWLGLALASPLVVGAAAPLSEDPDQLRDLERCGAAAIVLHSLFEEQLADEQLAVHQLTELGCDSQGEALSYMPDPAWFCVGEELYLRHLEQARASLSVPVIASLNGARCGGWVPGLAGHLDSELRSRLSGMLIRRTSDWASSLNGKEATRCEASKLVAAAASVPGKTIVLLRPALVSLGSGHAGDLRDDLEHGCDVVVGPTLSGGWYLLALGPKAHGLIDSAGAGEAGSAARLLGAARSIAGGLEAGLLRAERDLATGADLLAARADPLIDPGIATLLS